MPYLSTEILPLLVPFAAAMSAPTFANLQVLLAGVILAPGRRTVASALRVLGLAGERHFCNYHRFLARAHWSCRQLSRLLLGLLVRHLLPAGAPLRLVIDDTLERRAGKQVDYRGLFRDPVRSTARHVAYCWGIRWLCVCLLVELPGSRRSWALPFLTLPLLSEKTCARLKRRHRTLTEWAAIAMEWVRHWQPERDLVVVGDGSYAAVPLVHACQQCEKPIVLISRLRLDAVLHAPPEPRPAGKRGPKPKKGPRELKLAERLKDPKADWQRVRLRWYGGGEEELEFLSGRSLWYRGGHDPVPIRWVLVRERPATPGQRAIQATACFSSDPETPPEQILAAFVSRWNIEVTFEELRAHLGFETQRGWTARTLGRSAPCLFGVFSLVVLLAHHLHPQGVPVSQSAWYPKPEATFSDALAAVRSHLWQHAKSVASLAGGDSLQIPRALWIQLQRAACYAA